jgi:hypothetical protein
MYAEFERRIKKIIKNPKVEGKIIQIISNAGSEFPCLSCPSKDDCGSFNWFIKWFGKPK